MFRFLELWWFLKTCTFQPTWIHARITVNLTAISSNQADPVRMLPYAEQMNFVNYYVKKRCRLFASRWWFRNPCLELWGCSKENSSNSFNSRKPKFSDHLVKYDFVQSTVSQYTLDLFYNWIMNRSCAWLRSHSSAFSLCRLTLTFW